MSYKESNQAKAKTFSFLGLYNRARSRKQPQGENGSLITLCDAENIDIDDEGAISTRNGYTKSLTINDVVSAFSVASYKCAYAIANGVLKKINEDLSVTDLGSVTNKDCEWLEVGKRIFLSSGYIIDNDKLIPWLINRPTAPNYSIVSGRMPKGQYIIIATTLTPDGRESVSSDPIVIDLPDNSSIELTNVDGKIIYMTDPNGNVFYEIGYQVHIINNIPDGGKSINDALVLNKPLPDHVDKIAFFQGSIYCSVYDKETDTSCVAWSVYMLFHVFDFVNQVINDIEGEIRLLHGMPDGLLIGTDREIMILTDDSITRLANYGVPSGKALKANRDGRIFFQSLRGICTIPFQNLTIDKVSLSIGVCTSALVEHDGFEQFITMTDNGNPSEDSINF